MDRDGRSQVFLLVLKQFLPVSLMVMIDQGLPVSLYHVLLTLKQPSVSQLSFSQTNMRCDAYFEPHLVAIAMQGEIDGEDLSDIPDGPD